MQPVDFVKPIRVAVYGTLKSGESNHSLLHHSIFLGEGKTIPLFDISCNGYYPAIYGNGQSQIQVEVWEVSESQFERLDGLEGYPAHYNRTIIPVLLDIGKEVDAWIYHYDRPITHHASSSVTLHKNGGLSWSRKNIKN